MKKQIVRIFLSTETNGKYVQVSLLLFRVIASLELIVVHGLKKLGIGVDTAEVVPNPLGLPQDINQILAILGNIGFPVLIILGLFTRLATLPVLAVTLTGYWILHAHDPLLVRDVPFMYSLVFLLVLFVGPGRYSLDYLINKKLKK